MKKKILIIGGSVLAFLAVCATVLFAFVLPNLNKEPEKKMTLMIYMIGSDLEAKGGSGTKDIEEIVGSGVDLSTTNVVVYAGGSKKWHNEIVSAEEVHSLLELKEGGFQNVKTFDTKSMGDAQCLSDFLNYVHTNYPAQKFSLILWDHGNGPLIGYGMDMLYDDDALTLLEMQSALKNSPFNTENKLAFVGFDACLMSSAELCCTWSDYAEYLIASQEIEPSFGWDYAFLKDLCNVEVSTLSETIVNTYLDTCEKYYEKKGYEDRDTTLACMDLSKTNELKTAIENLFSKASDDVKSKYNEIAVNRVNTRALGRASTGSEYDLVDLYDLAQQMENDYSSEAKALMNAVENMVISNATNADKLCGVSIYYPFYNKSYYEKTWGSVYKELNVFPKYNSFIDSYSEKWLDDDLLKTNASSVAPSQTTKSEFTLELTDEQAESYASAGYYILQKEGEELYTKVYSSHNITKDDNTLIANFDGQILYARDKFNYMMPVAQEHDTVGDLTRYSVYVNLSNELMSFLDVPEGYERKVQGHRFHITANNNTKEISTSALVPYDVKVDNDKLISGKIDDADLSQWTTYYFLQEGHSYITRYDDNTIKPYEEWETSSFYSAYTSRVGDGLEFVFAPLVKGEYCLVFEIEDTQGNKYCSELLPITADGNIEPLEAREEIEVEWDEDEDKVKLLDEENIELYLTTVESYDGKGYTIEAKNDNDYDIFISGENLVYNDKYYCDNGSLSFYRVPANSTEAYEYRFDFGSAEELKIVKEINSLEFSLSVYTYKNDRTIINDQFFYVTIPDSQEIIPGADDMWGDYDYYQRDKVTRGIFAENQTLFEKNGVKATLVRLGGDGEENGKLVGHIRLENTSDSVRYVQFDNLILDSVCMDINMSTVILPSKAVVDRAFVIDEEELDLYMITSVKTAAVRLRFMDKYTLDGGGGSSEPYKYDIKLKEKGSGSEFVEGTEVLYEENGVRISLIRTEVPEDYNSYYYWYLSIVNNSGKDLYYSFDSEDATINGKVQSNFDFSGLGISNYRCGNKEKAVITMFCDESKGDEIEAEFTFDFYDFKNEKLLWSGSTPITLKAKK